MSEDKQINLSEELEMSKPERGINFGLKKNDVAEMNRENTCELINKTLDILNLVQMDKEELLEVLPEPTVESRMMAEKVDAYIIQSAEKIIKLRQLELQLAELPVELDSEMPEVAEQKIPTEENKETELKNEIVGEKEGLTFPIFRDIVAHPERLDKYATAIKGIKKMIERHGGDASALSEKEQRLASWLIYKHDFGKADTKLCDIDQICKPNTVAVIFNGDKYKFISVDGNAVENNLFIKSDDKNITANKPARPPEETISVLAAESEYEKVWEKVKNKLVKIISTENTAPFVLPGSVGGSDEFILNIIQKVNETDYLDLTNKNLMELLGYELDDFKAEIYKAVEDEIFGTLPKEADVLLDPAGPGDGAVVLEGGSSAIKFVDSNTGKGFFTYSPEYSFYQNESGDLIAKKDGVEYFIKPLIKEGVLEVVFEEIIK